MNTLAPICKSLAQTGTPKQAKGAIHCIFKNMPNLHETLFPEILTCVKSNLCPESPYYRTAIVTLGHIAFNVPERYKVQIKNIVSRKVSENLYTCFAKLTHHLKNMDQIKFAIIFLSSVRF